MMLVGFDSFARGVCLLIAHICTIPMSQSQFKEFTNGHLPKYNGLSQCWCPLLEESGRLT